MRSIPFLDTQAWKESEGSSTEDDRRSEIKSAVVSITDVFRAPLEAKGADLTSIVDEIEELTLGSGAIATARFGTNCTLHLILQSSQTSFW